MTHDDFLERVLTPFVRRHSQHKAAELLGVHKGHLSRILAGQRPVSARLAQQFGCVLTDNVASNAGAYPRYCIDCRATTQHRRVFMLYIDRPAVQCLECMTIEINLQARSLLERN